MTVQLALRKHDARIAARFIQWWTGSIYSHCELVVEGVCYSSSVMDKGVRSKNIEFDPKKWDIIELPWANAQSILDYFERTDGHTYGWGSMIYSQMFNRNLSIEESQFCSEWCANALGLPNPVSYSPGSLAATCGFLTFRPLMAA